MSGEGFVAADYATYQEISSMQQPDDRTHGDHSAVDDERPLPSRFSLSVAEIRAASIETGREVRVQVERMPDSQDKRELLRIQDEMERFWQNASDAFVEQWVLVALAVQ